MSSHRDAEMAATVGLVCLLVIAVLWVCGALISASAYTDGYCDALGGTRITNYTCDVHGKVVRP